MQPLKRCTSCGEFKPTASFYRHARHKDGFRSECKLCTNGQNARYTESNPRARREYNARWMREERKLKPEQAKSRDARGRETNGPIRRARTRQWMDANPERVRANARRWSKANPEKRLATFNTRRARMKGAGGKHTAADMRTQYQAQQGLCYYCSKPLCGKYEGDHKIPIARGGTSWPENMVCACAKCNRKKHTRTDLEFFAWLGQTKAAA